MADLNGLITAATEKRGRLERDLKEFVGMYQDLSREASSLFKEQLAEQKGKVEGLEDFYDLVNTLKSNDKLIKSCLGVFMRSKPISNFDITVEEKPEKSIKEKTTA